MNTLDKYVQKHIVKYSGAGPISKGGGASSNLSMSLDTAALAGRIDDIEEQLKLIAASLKNYHTLSITFENIDLPLVDIHVSGGMAVLSGYTEVIPETTITVDTSLWVAGVNKYIVWYNGTIVVADEILEGYKLLAYIIIPEDWDGTVSNSYKDGAAYISIAGPIDELDPYYGEVLILELDAEAGPFFCIVHASWDPLGSPDVSHYILSYTIDGNNWENISTANPAASFEAPHNIQVAAKVQAVFNNGRKTHWSATEIIQTPGDDTIPLPVTGLEVTSQFGIIKAIWDESTDIDFDTFEIQVARDDQFTDPEVTFTTNTSYAFAGEPEATYYIRVRVIDYSSNTSLWSDTIEIETVMGDGNTPAAPTGLTLVPILEDETSYITATWDRNEELDIVSYELAISYDQTNWVDYQTPKTTKTIEVVGGVTLYAKVRALDNEGLVSAWSDIVETTTAHDTEAPNIPVGLTITNSFGIVYFTWTANGESDFSHYIIQISQTDQFSTYDEVIQRTNSYSFSGIPGTTYYVRIKSVDYSGNESDWSSIASTTVTAGDGQPPATPTGLSLTTYLQSYSSYIEATWDENEEVDLLGYQIAWSLDQLKWNILSVNSPEANFSVPGNSTIYVKVKALDVEGLASQWSDAESITSTEDEEAPATPVLLSNIPLYARALIEIEEQEESDFSHFLVSYKDRSFTTSTTNIEIPLDPGESGVSVSIKAVDLSGNESPALAVSASARTLSEAEEEFFELINKVHGGSTNTETIAYITDDLVDHMNITKPTAFDRSGLLKDDVYDTIDRIDNIDYGDLTLPIESVFERIDTDFISVGSSLSEARSKIFDIEIGEEIKNIDEWVGVINTDVSDITTRIDFINYGELTGTIETVLGSVYSNVSAISEKIYDIVIGEITLDIDEWIDQINSDLSGVTTRINAVVYGSLTDSIEDVLAAVHGDISGIETKVFDIEIGEVTHDIDEWMGLLNGDVAGIISRLENVSYNETTDTIETQIAAIALDINGLSSIVYDITIDETTQDVNQWISTLSQRADSIELSISGISQTVGEHTSSISQMSIDISGIEAVVYNITIDTVTQDVDQWVSQIKQEADAITLRLDHVVIDEDDQTLEQHVSQIKLDISGIESVVYDITIDTVTQDINQWVSTLSQRSDSIELSVQGLSQTVGEHSSSLSQLTIDVSGIEGVVYNIQIGEDAQDVDQWISTLSQRADSIELSVSGLSSDVGENSASISQLVIDVSGIEGVVYDITVGEATQNVDQWVSQIKQEADAITLRLDHVVIDEDDQTLEQHVSQIKLDISGIESVVYDIQIGETTQDINQWISTLSQRADSIELNVSGISETVGTHTTNISSLQLDVSGIEAIVKDITIDTVTQDINEWVSQIKQEADAITLRLDNVVVDESTKTVEQHLSQIVLDIDGIEAIVKDITIDEVTQDVDLWISTLSQRADSIELSVQTVSQTVEGHTTTISQLSIDVSGIEGIVYNIEIGEDQYDVDQWISVLSQRADSIELSVTNLSGDVGTNTASIGQLTIDVEGIKTLVYDVTVGDVTHDIDEWLSALSQEDISIKQDLEAAALALRSKIESEFTNAETVLYIVGDPLDHQTDTAPINYDRTTSIFDITYDTFERLNNFEIDGVTGTIEYWASSISQTTQNITLRIDGIVYDGEQKTLEQAFSAIEMNIDGITSTVYDLEIDGTTQNIDQWVSQIKQETDNITFRLDHFVIDQEDMTAEQHVSQLKLSIDGLESVVYSIQVDEITQDVDLWISTLSQRADGIELNVSTLSSTVDGHTSSISSIQLDVGAIELIVKDITVDETTQDADEWISQIKQEADAITLRLDHVVIDEDDQTLEQHVSQFRLDIDGITSIVTDITIDEETYDVNQWISVLSQRSDAIELSVSTLSGDVASAISQLTIDVSGIEGVVYNITIDETTQNIDEWVSQIKQEADAITLRLDHVVIGEDDQTLEQHVSQIKIDIGGVESIVYDIQIGETTQDVNEWVSQIKQESDAIELRVETAEGTITSHSSSISSLNLSVDGIEAVVYNIAIEEEGDIHDVDEWLALFHIRENAIELSITNLSTTVSSNTQSISSIEIDVGAIDLRVQSVESTTSTHTTQISDLDIALGSITATVGSIEDTVDGHTSSISQIELDVGGITSTVQTISDTVGGHTSQISQINQDIGSIELTVQGVEEDVGTNTSAIAQIELSIDGISTSISSLETTVGGHTSQISQIELDIGTIELSVSSISSTVGQHTTDISAINVSLGEITSIVGAIEEDLDQEGDPLTQTYNYSLFQQLADSIALRVVAVDEFGDPQATELIIEDGLVTIAANQFRVHGDAMINGSISGEKLKANSVEANKLIVWPDIPIDDETAEYWGTSLLGALGITLPDGMDEVTKENLADLLPPGTILAEYFAVGQKMVVGNKVVIERDLDDYGHMTVFDSDYEIVVKVGENATPDGRDGMFINTGGAFQVGQLIDPNYLKYYNGILTIKGVVEATGGFFDEVVYVGVEEGERILLDGVNKLIRSENYQAGTAGFELNGDGTAEFNDITVRGSVHASEGSIDGVMTIGDIEIGVGVNEGAGTGWFVDENNYWYSNLGFSIGNGSTNKFQYSPEGGLEIVTTKILVDIDENILIDSENKVIAIGTMTGFDTASGNGVFTGMHNSKPSFKVGQNDPDGDLQKGISYYDGIFSFMGAVISMENLDDPTQEALSGYEVMISPAGDSVYNDGTTRTPTSINFTATLLRKVDNTLVSSGLAYYWTVETDGGITIPSGALTATATVNTSNMTGPSVIKVKVTYQEKDYYGYASLAYSEKGTGGDDAVIYWLTSSKEKVVYNPNTGQYDGGASSSIVFTAKEAVGQVVQNKTGLYWKVNGVNAEPDANGYQKTVAVSSQTTTTIEIYADFAREQLLDTFTVPVITEGSDSYSIILSNEHQTVESNYDGTSPTPASISTQVKLYKGTTEITSFTVEATGATVDGKTVTVTIPSSSTMAGSQDITVKIDSTIIGVKTLTWSKSPQGEPGIGGEDAQALFLTADAQIFKADQDNTITSGDITLEAFLQNLSGTITWTAKNQSNNDITLTGTGSTRTLTAANFGASDWVKITVSLGGLSDSITIVRVKEGSNAIVGFLTNESHNVPCDSDGSNPDFTGASSILKIFRGNTQETSGWSCSWSLITGTATGQASTTTLTNDTITIQSLSTDVAVYRCTATKSGQSSVVKDFTITKSYAGDPGDPGADATSYYITSTKDKIVYDPGTGQYDGGATTTVTLSGWRKEGTNSPQATSFYWKRGATALGAATSKTITVPTDTSSSFTMTAYIDSSYTYLAASFTVAIVASGEPGDPGGDGVTRYISATKDKVVYDPNTGLYDGSASTTITFTAKKVVGDGSPANETVYWKRGSSALGSGTSKSVVVPTDTNTSFTMYTYADSGYTILLSSFTVSVVTSGASIYALPTASAYHVEYNGSSYSPSSVTITPALKQGTTSLSFTNWRIKYINISGDLITINRSTSSAYSFSMSLAQFIVPKTDVVLIIEIDYGGVTYTARLIIVVEDTRYGWLSQWTGTTLIGGTYIVTPTAFMGTDANNGVLIDANGILGKKSGAKTFELTDDGDLDVASGRIGGSSGWLIETLSGKGRISSTGIELVSGDDAYIQAGSSEENYRMNANGLEYRRLIKARINNIKAYAECDASASAIIEVWYRWTENYSDASPTWSGWQHPDDLNFSASFTWYISPTDPIYGADMTDFAMQFKFVIYSTSVFKAKLQKWNVYINDEPSLTVEIDTMEQFQAHADATTSGITYSSGGYVQPTSYSSSGTYVTKASSIREEIEPGTDISKVLHSIHKGTIYFDGTSGDMSKRIQHNKHIMPTRYDVILNESNSQIWKSSFSTGTNYTRKIEVTKAEDYFDILFCAEEGTTSTNIGTIGMQSNNTWLILANVANCSKIEFDVYHWGGFRIFKEHVSYSFSSPYTGDIGYKYYDGVLYLSWNGDTTPEYQIEGLVGMVAARDIIKWTSGTRYPLTGNFNYEIQVWQ